MDKIMVLDFGSQYTQLIARRLREQNVLAEIVPPTIRAEEVRRSNPKGIVLSGGPSSPHDGEVLFDCEVVDLDVPILGVCYGMQLLNTIGGGTVRAIGRGEYGSQAIDVDAECTLFGGMASKQTVWMSHGHTVDAMSSDYRKTATSGDGLVAAVAHKERPVFGVQFHPEVSHTDEGAAILSNFIDRCACSRSWTTGSVVEDAVARIREKVGDGRIVSLVSGGVDSTAATLLCLRAVGPERVIPIHIDNGLMREGESGAVCELLRDTGIENLDLVDASDVFLAALEGESDPETKRRIIGDLFVEIVEREVEKLGATDAETFFCQGTLYTDLIESGKGCGKHAAVIKTHHNVNPPSIARKREQGLIVEPNDRIFKDEVRRVSELLGVPHDLAWRHPFPGPGLAIRIIGSVTAERLATLRKADSIYLEELRAAGLYDEIWQAFAVLVPVSTVGVMGDARTEGQVIALRAVTSCDGMTADIYPMPYDVVGRIATRIVNEVPGVNRVVYDVTSKPPGTIEWE